MYEKQLIIGLVVTVWLIIFVIVVLFWKARRMDEKREKED